jgi:Phosphoglycerate mutase 1
MNDFLENGKLIYERNQSLNERDYGDLVGLNKAETAEKFGKEQVHIWRRSYDTPPPKGESLKDVVERVSPYFKEQIEPLLLAEKNILISAHGNSLRAIMIKVGLYKPEEISSIELPTGCPLCLEYEKGILINNYYLD